MENTVQQPNNEVISPAEAKFWREQADKASALLRESAVRDLSGTYQVAGAYKVSGVALGTALGLATFTKYVPSKWKWLSGAAAGASMAFGVASGVLQGRTSQMQQRVLGYADALERDPAMKEQLANWLSSFVTADMAHAGIEKAVAEQAVAMALHRPQLQNMFSSPRETQIPCR
jgi:hypothetical protein